MGVLFIFLDDYVGGVSTGWLHDLEVGTETEQGQKLGPSVQMIESKEEACKLFFEKNPIPATASGFTRRSCGKMKYGY